MFSLTLILTSVVLCLTSTIYFFSAVVLTAVRVSKMPMKRFQLDISCMSALALIVMVLC